MLNYVPKLVNGEVNSWLVKEMEEKVIRKYVFQLGIYKAPGPDRFNGFFYQKYWDIVNKDMVEAVREFFKTGRMLKELNATKIVLILKVKGLKEVSQFSPISLCNFAYKVISKVLVNRL